MPQDSHLIQSLKHALKATILEPLLKLRENVSELVNIADREGERDLVAFKVWRERDLSYPAQVEGFYRLADIFLQAGQARVAYLAQHRFDRFEFVVA